MARRSHGPSLSSASDLTDDRDAVPEYLEPIIAGARARGVADTFELLGIDAILIDPAGRVLHSGPNLERLLAPAVQIIEGNLLGCDAALDEVLQRLIASAISPPEQSSAADETVIRRAGGTRPLRIRIIRYSAGDHDRFQLLRAVLTVTLDSA